VSPLSSRLGLVENPACASLRTQEGILVGQIASAQAGLASVGKEQQDCEAGIGPAGPCSNLFEMKYLTRIRKGERRSHSRICSRDSVARRRPQPSANEGFRSSTSVKH
jgi:hypothetical protein